MSSYSRLAAISISVGLSFVVLTVSLPSARAAKAPFSSAELRGAKALVIKEYGLKLRVTDRKTIARVVRTMSFRTKRRCRCTIAFTMRFELKGGRKAAIDVFSDYWSFGDSVARRTRGLAKVLAKLIRPERHRLALRGLAHKDSDKRWDAITELGRLGRHAARAVPALIKLLENDPVIELRAHVASTLSRINKPAKTVKAALERAAKSLKTKVAAAARSALQSIAAEQKYQRRRRARRGRR